MPETMCKRYAASFSLQDDQTDAGGKFKIVARSAEPVDRYWESGGIVHDNSSVRHRERIGIDYAHGEDLIGYADRIANEGGSLVVYGRLTSVQEGDLAAQIIAKAKLGVPYEASIYWDEDRETEWKQYTNENVTVNGKTYMASKDYPISVVRNWLLHRVAICGTGRDDHTSTHFYTKEKCQSDTASIDLEFADKSANVHGRAGNGEEENMSEKPTDVPMPAKAEEKVDVPVVKSGEDMEYAVGLLRAYETEFGEKGVAYFRRGLSLEQARSAYVQDLAKEIAELKASADKQKALSDGYEEDIPVVADGEVAGTPAKKKKSQSDNNANHWLQFNAIPNIKKGGTNA